MNIEDLEKELESYQDEIAHLEEISTGRLSFTLAIERLFRKCERIKEQIRQSKTNTP